MIWQSGAVLMHDAAGKYFKSKYKKQLAIYKMSVILVIEQIKVRTEKLCRL